jgi:hypothetical protein
LPKLKEINAPPRAELSDAAFEQLFVSLVTRLAESDWFPPKVSACSLFSDALKRTNEANKEKLLGLYVSLCKDETPMVRRAAASNLKVCSARALFGDSELTESFRTFSRF